MESGEPVQDEDGEPLRVQFATPPGSRARCNCVFVAVASDALSAYLADRDPLAARSTLSYVGQRIHEDADFSIEDAITAWRARDEQRTLAKLAQLDPSAAAPEREAKPTTPAAGSRKGTRVAPPVPPEPAKGAWRSQARTRRWFDETEGDLTSKVF
jgi:hypothetical protein